MCDFTQQEPRRKFSCLDLSLGPKFLCFDFENGREYILKVPTQPEKKKINFMWETTSALY